MLQACTDKSSKKDTRQKPDISYEEGMKYYTGTESCRECHEKEYDEWTGSHHDLAMMKAGEKSVKGDFNDAVFDSQGVHTRFYKEGGKYMIDTEGPEGKPGTFTITHTFGITPLQQYMVPFPDGSYHCTRQAWDTIQGKWFDLYPDIKVSPDEWIYWTKGGLNWNTMCSDCHSTYVRKNYNPEKKTYHTTYAIIDVSCEACHGPGKAHIDLVNSEEYKKDSASRLWDQHMYMTTFMKPKEMVDQCARCHSLRTQFTEYYDHKGIFMDHYAPDLLREGVYFADGQILGEVYVYGSFTQSEMYKQNIKCSDCHNIHSLKLKYDGNALCAQCHEPLTYDSPAHHFHEQGTEGAECINCHMPGRYYMGNDFRRDHSFRVPRPDLSVRFNTPNACNDCHEDEGFQWQADAVVKWYGPQRAPHFSDALAFGRTRDQQSLSGLIKLVRNTAEPAVARATAVFYLSDMPFDRARATIIGALNDPDPLLRYTAARMLDNLLTPDQKIKLLTPLLNDPVRSVRIGAVGSLAGVPLEKLKPEDREKYETATGEFLTGLFVREDFPGGQMEKAHYYEKLGEIDKAEKAYIEALRLDDRFNMARMNLANLYYNKKEFKKAEDLFKTVVEQEPGFGQAYYSMGLLLAEQNKMEEAAGYMKEAVKYIDYNDRVDYNYGLVLQQLGKTAQAESVFRKALVKYPGSEANRYALVFLLIKQKRWDEARTNLKKLLEIAPQNQQYQKMLKDIDNRQKAS
jgi:Tfp pilus assembly protein PilF